MIEEKWRGSHRKTFAIQFQNFDDALDKLTCMLYERVNLDVYQFNEREMTNNGS